MPAFYEKSWAAVGLITLTIWLWHYARGQRIRRDMVRGLYLEGDHVSQWVGDTTVSRGVLDLSPPVVK